MATIISRPKRGDIVTKRIADKTPVYFQLEGFVLEDIDTTIYEIVVYLFLNNNNNRIQW